MPRAAEVKNYNNFSAGYITEATGLTFPENSLQDVDNCDIELDGSIRRRLGLNQEIGGSTIGAGLLDTFTYSGSSGPDGNSIGGTVQSEEFATSWHVWRNPGGVANLNFIVFQLGTVLLVRNWDAEAISDIGAIGAVITGTNTFEFVGVTGYGFKHSKAECAVVPLESADGFGKLYFTNHTVVPFYMDFDPDTLVLSLHRVRTRQFGTTINLAIRDFTGADDGLAADVRPVTLSDQHGYNLVNQGWNYERYFDYKTDGDLDGLWPSNAQQWYVAKNPEGEFSADRLDEQDFGNSLAPRGHVVYDALKGERIAYDNTEDGVDYDLGPEDDEPAQAGFNAAAFFAGRLWLGGLACAKRPGGVYFSRILRAADDAGIFCQVQDPTSEHFPDLLATDGGYIPVPEAQNILKLEPFGAGLMIMAENGVWFVYGGEGGFTAESFAVEKVSSTGVISAKSVTRTDQYVTFWAENSVHVAALPDSGVIPVIQDVGGPKIQTYYNRIRRAAKQKATGGFDPISRKVFWLWRDAPSYSFPAYQHVNNQMLIFDTRTAAFSKHSFTIDDEQVFGPAAPFPQRGYTSPVDLNEPVLVGTDPVLVGAEEVTVGISFTEDDEFLTSIKILMVDNGGTESLRIAEFYDMSYVDYATMVTLDATDYTSFLIVGEETLGVPERNKQATYIHNYFTKTENGYTRNDDSELVYNRPSACYLVGMWDWHITNGGHRHTAPQKAYRYRRPYVPIDSDDVVDNGEKIVYTKLKLRGKGRSLAVKYYSETRKDFRLLGYSIPFTADGAD